MLNTIQHKNLVAETISAILVSKNITEAAELLEVDRSTLYKRFKTHPEIKEIAFTVQEYSQQALKLASAKAVNVLVKCLDHMQTDIRIQAAKEILDRVGIIKENTKNTLPAPNNVGNPTKLEFVAQKDEK